MGKPFLTHLSTLVVFQESICFYGGEESEAERMEQLYAPWTPWTLQPF